MKKIIPFLIIALHLWTASVHPSYFKKFTAPFKTLVSPIQKAIDGCFYHLKSNEKYFFSFIAAGLFLRDDIKNQKLKEPVRFGLYGLFLWYLWYGFSYGGLPEPLYELKNFDFVRWPVIKQAGPSCGWHAVFNARGIQEGALQGLFEQHRNNVTKINKVLHDIRFDWFSYVKKNYESVKEKVGVTKIFKGIGSLSTVKLAKLIGLSNFFYIRAEVGEGYFRADQKNDNKFYCINNLDKICAMVRNNDAPIKHILFSFPSGYVKYHLVTFSIITRKDKKPLLVYADSNNHSLLEGSCSDAQSYFVTKFIMALDEVYGSKSSTG